MPSKQRIIYVFFGLIASGKSTMASAWARVGGLPYHNSDAVRKELAGVSGQSRQGAAYEAGIYSREFSRKTYDALLAAAALDLRQGHCPVLDASYALAEERSRLVGLASQEKAAIVFILCRCSEQETRRRLELRAKDPAAVSDADWEIYLRQKERFEYPAELSAGMLLTIDTDAEPAQLLKRLEEMLHIG
jgi:predicted kinase